MSKESEQRAHDRGEQDGADGKSYDRPNNFLGPLGDFFHTKAEDAENSKYEAGYQKGSEDRKDGK